MTDRQTLLSLSSEEEFQEAVIGYARLCGWKVHHTRPARTSKGWKTPIQGDKSFPDLVMARKGRLAIAELKSTKGRTAPMTKRDTAWEAYEEAIAPAEKAYQEARAPAEKAYEEAIAPTEKAYKEARATAEKAYQEATAPAWKAYEEAIAQLGGEAGRRRKMVKAKQNYKWTPWYYGLMPGTHYRVRLPGGKTEECLPWERRRSCTICNRS